MAAACGGLLNAVALMYARDMASLCQAGLDTIRMARRLSQIVLWRARSLHNGPGCWGWLVSGIKAGDLQAMLDSYHAVESTPNHRTIKVAGSGVADAWHTVIGPPAVLEDFFGQYPPCQRLTKSRLQVTGPVHVIPDVQLAEVEHIAAGMTCVHGMLDSSPRTDIQLVSLGEGGLLSAPTWKELLELVVREILSQPLNMTRGLTAVESAIPHDAMVNVFGAGPSPHIPTLCVYLKGKGRKVISVATEPESPSAPLPGQGSGRIAIVGMGGRYPRSGDLEEFWDKICQGKALHSEVRTITIQDLLKQKGVQTNMLDYRYQRNDSAWTITTAQATHPTPPTPSTDVFLTAQGNSTPVSSTFRRGRRWRLIHPTACFSLLCTKP